jgi:hypothetical protein
VDVDCPRISEQRCDLFRQRRVEIGQLWSRFEPRDELCRRAHADVRADERFLEPLPGRVVTRIEGGRRELGREGGPALGERVPQAREEPSTLRLGLRLCVLLAE